MSSTDIRSQYIWRPHIVPELCVVLFTVVAAMVIFPSMSLGCHFERLPYGDNLKDHPESSSDQELGLDGYGNYYLNRQPIQSEDLPRLLRAIFDNRTEDRVLYVRADKRLPYARVLDVFDIASQNGVHVAAMVVDKRPPPNVH